MTVYKGAHFSLVASS